MRGDPEVTVRDKYQAALDRVAERRLADAEYERSLREDSGIERYDREVIWGGRR